MSPLLPIRAVAVDLDGTLLGREGNLSPRAQHAVAQTRKRGIPVIMATGRSYQSALPFRQALQLTEPIICYNGAQVRTGERDDILFEAYLEADLFRTVLRLARESAIHFQAYAGETLYFEKRGPDASLYEEIHRLKGVCIDMETLNPRTFNKAMFVGTPARLAPIREALQKYCSDRDQLVNTSDFFLEVLGRGISKGNALKSVLERLGILPEETIAFGDERNDLAMIELVGRGVAMGNAVDSLKEVASLHTATNEQDGVALLLEELLGIPCEGEGRTMRMDCSSP